MGSVQAVESLVEGAVRRMGRVDILVNNAGMEKQRPLLEVTEEDCDRVLAVNLKARVLREARRS